MLRCRLNEEFAAAGDLHIATEDGSAGVKGNVMDAVREDHLEADVIFACGPAPMLRAIKAYGLEKGIPCWISMEEKMACGVGACLACVCQSTGVSVSGISGKDQSSLKTERKNPDCD